MRSFYLKMPKLLKRIGQTFELWEELVGGILSILDNRVKVFERQHITTMKVGLDVNIAMTSGVEALFE